MASDSLVYKVEDRSLLLPLYKRLLIAPLIKLIPARVNPNSITHAGHLLNLLGVAVLLALWPVGGWPFAFAVLCVQLYNWCDNADGAHARATNQCSALGEFLDHGLDLLNTTYIAYLAAMSVGAEPLWWVALALVLPGAAAMTYWEQAQTGMFHLGMLNQVESIMLLSVTLLVAAIFGTQLYAVVHLGPINARMVLLTFVFTTASVGILHGIWRVSRRGYMQLISALPLLSFCAIVFVAAWTSALSPIAAIVVGTAGNVFFGLRMLRHRLSAKRPKIEVGLLLGSLFLSGPIVWRLLGRSVGETTQIVLAAATCTFLGVLAILSAREGVMRVGVIDREAALARASAGE